MFGGQQFQGIAQLRVIEWLMVARDQPDLLTVLEDEGPIAIEFDLIEPIALRQMIDQERLYRGGRRMGDVRLKRLVSQFR